MQGDDAVNHIAQYLGQSFINNIDVPVFEKKRIAETLEMGLRGQDGKNHVIRVTLVLEPQVFGETIYNNLESSVTHGMKLLEANDETTIPEHSSF